jgi:hypothetical protein
MTAMAATKRAPGRGSQAPWAWSCAGRRLPRCADDELPPLERYQVLKRIAWLNGKRCRTVRDYDDGCLPIEVGISERFKAWKAAQENPAAARMTADTRADQPLSPKLESLARGEFIRPDLVSFFWGLIWLLPLAVVIPVLWIALYTGFFTGTYILRACEIRRPVGAGTHADASTQLTGPCYQSFGERDQASERPGPITLARTNNVGE